MKNKDKQIIEITVSLILCLMLTANPFFANQESFDIDELLEQAGEKVDEADEPAAIELYEQILEIEPDNFEALWNLSLLYSKEGYRYEDEELMKHYFEKGKALAEKVLEDYPDEAYSHYVYAVATGRIAEILSPRERISASKEIREHVEKALEIDGEHEGSWHLLGVWHTRSANLTRAERWAANLLFGGAPEGASNSEAERCLLKAIELDPENILFHLDLARFYREVGRDSEAIEVLNKTLQLEPRKMDDPDHLEEARKILAELELTKN